MAAAEGCRRRGGGRAPPGGGGGRGLAAHGPKGGRLRREGGRGAVLRGGERLAAAPQPRTAGGRRAAGEHSIAAGTGRHRGFPQHRRARRSSHSTESHRQLPEGSPPQPCGKQHFDSFLAWPHTAATLLGESLLEAAGTGLAQGWLLLQQKRTQPKKTN